jgi:hypothetical protein
MFELFAAGSFAYLLIFVALPVVLLIALSDRNRGGEAFVVLIAFALLSALFSDFNPIKWLWEHPWELLIYGGVYILAGAAIGAIRWVIFAKGKASQYEMLRRKYLPDFLNANNFPDLNDPVRAEKFRDFMRGKHEVSSLGPLPPHPRNNKARIVTWMAYWPFVGLWTFTYRPLRAIWNFLYETFAGFFERVSKRIFGRFDEFNH